MVDISSYRISIGMFNCNIKSSYKPINNPSHENKTTISKIYLSIFIIVFISLEISEFYNQYNHIKTGALIQCAMNDCNEILHFRNHIILFDSHINWNLFMRMTNGNGKETLTISHWNGGGSYLGMSDRGKEKLRNIKFLLSEYKMDIFGVSEANVSSLLSESEYHIDGYDTILSQGNPSRLIVYIKNNLSYKVRNDLKTDVAAIWLQVGKYKNKWLICQYYRQHKLIGINGSETLIEQHNRLDIFLDKISSIQHSNSLIIGDFNITYMIQI